MTRFPDWEQRLDREIRAAASRVFAWGVFDCVLFPADCVLAMTGHDPAAEWRGRYSDEAGARRLMAEAGGLPGLADRAGLARLPTWRFGRRGDAVLLRVAGNDSLGIVDLSGQSIVAATFRGTVRVPIAKSLQAWRI